MNDDTTQEPVTQINEVTTNEVTANEVEPPEVPTLTEAVPQASDPADEAPPEVPAPDYRRDHPSLGAEFQEDIHRFENGLGVTLTRLRNGFVHLRPIRFFGRMITNFKYIADGKDVPPGEVPEHVQALMTQRDEGAKQ